jgi:GNAT superfamily N-acetyltransferase
VAEDGSRPVACGLLYAHRHTGLMRTGLVLPEARGHGLQRALIDARARLAGELGCQLLASHTVRGSHSERNVEQMGLAPVWAYDVYRFEPHDDPSPDLTERRA